MGPSHRSPLRIFKFPAASLLALASACGAGGGPGAPGGGVGDGNDGGDGAGGGGGGDGGAGGGGGGGSPATLVAFPGAEGFGAVATGGRGGRVVYVTTLAAAGPGSLQDALDQDGPRYVLFRVSGVIDGEVHLTKGDVTIAGQTSPGGVVVRGFHTTEEPYCDQGEGCFASAARADNWILRHLRTRPAGAGLDDGLRLRATRRAIVDHCSIANARDEAVEISLSNHVTVQHCLIAETLGDHADRGGMLVNYSAPSAGLALDRLSIHHDAWNRILGRMPELSRESPGASGTTMRIEVSNNLLWDPGYYVDVNTTTVSGTGDGDPLHYEMNFVGNLAWARPGFPYGMIALPFSVPGPSSAYLADDRLNLYPGRADYDLVYCCNDYATHVPDGTSPAWARASRHDFPPITYVPSISLRDFMVRNVGAFPRDRMDRRLMEPVRTGVFDPAPRDANPYADALALDFDPASPPTPPADTDGDGMPDDWERAHGLNSAVAAPNDTTLSRSLTGVEGYTDLECYLNELADRRVSEGGD